MQFVLTLISLKSTEVHGKRTALNVPLASEIIEQGRAFVDPAVPRRAGAEKSVHEPLGLVGSAENLPSDL